MGRLPKNLSVSVSNKTFNVFDPFPSRRKIIHSFTLHVIIMILILYGVIFCGFWVFPNIFQIGLVLGLTIFVTGLALMMIDEAYEIHKNANIFLKAVKNGANLGNGDLAVLFLVKEVLPKLSAYYLFLAIVFFTSSIALPYVVPAFLMILSQFVSMIIKIGGYLSFIVFALLSTLVIFIVYAAAKKIRRKVVRFIRQS